MNTIELGSVWPSVGAAAGEGLGKGISSSLEALTQQKLQELQRRRNEYGLAGIGYAPQQAHGMSYLGDDFLKAILSHPRGQGMGSSGAMNPEAKESAAQIMHLVSGCPIEECRMLQDIPNRQMQTNIGNEMMRLGTMQQGEPGQVGAGEGTNGQQQENPYVAARQAEIQQGQQIKKAQLEGIKQKTELAAQESQRKMQEAQRKAQSEEQKIKTSEMKGKSEKEKLEFKKQQTLKPFLDQQEKDFESHRRASKIAEKMLSLIEENRASWPGVSTGILPQAARELFIRNPAVREYLAEATHLVSEMANTRRGVPTNFKIKLEQLGKADINMPVETQIDLLQSVINRSKEISSIQDYIESQRNKETGNLPLDIKQKVMREEKMQDNPLDYPEEYEEGTVYKDRKGTHIIKNGKWAKA